MSTSVFRSEAATAPRTYIEHGSPQFLLFYFTGASAAGPVGGWSCSATGWAGVVAVIVTALALALVLSLRLTRIPPAPTRSTPEQ